MLITAQAVAQRDGAVVSKEQVQRRIDQELIDTPMQPIRLALPSDDKESRDSTTISSFKVLPFRYSKRALQGKFFGRFEGEEKQFLNLASYNLAYAALGWRIDSRFNITGGLLAIKQFSNPLSYGIDRVGARFNLNYSVADQLNFNLWGQYVTGSSINLPIDVMLPQTGAGASMVLNLGGGSQIGIGTQYQYDEQKEKGSYQSGGKLKLSF